HYPPLSAYHPLPCLFSPLSPHAALPIWDRPPSRWLRGRHSPGLRPHRRSGCGDRGDLRLHRAATPSHARREHLLRRTLEVTRPEDRKSTRLNSSHVSISYAVFCLINILH